MATPTPPATPLLTPPAPSNLHASAVGCLNIELSWRDNSTNENGFKVERSVDGSNFNQIDIVGRNVTTYLDHLGTSGLRYYRVRAYNGAGNSYYSNIASANTIVFCGNPTPTPSPTATPTPTGTPRAPIVWQSDGSAANIQLIHDTQAQDGDTIMLPAGTFSWTQVVKIRKGITVQGQSMTYQTGYVWFNSAYADDQTIILDDSTDGRLISMSLLPTQSGRITGITFRPGTTRNTVPNHAPVGLSGSQGQNKNIRLDHCHFDHLISHNVFAYNVLGLADHNLHEAGAHAFSYYFENGDWGGESRGNGSWADYPYYGSDLFFFVEDCTIRGLPGPAVGGGCDAFNGARYVFRWNHWENAHHANHGTEANPIRGTRNRMLYHNRFNLDIGSLGAFIGGQRSGGAIIHDNETTGAPPGTYPSLGNPAVYREFNRAAAWGFAQGSNPWDVNVNGGQLFESGTATIGSVIGVVKDTHKTLDARSVGGLFHN